MKLAGLWLLSLVVVAAGSSAVTLVVTRSGAAGAPPTALPWTMGAQSVETRQSESATHARGAFINLPASCDAFSPATATLFADEIIITRAANTPRQVEAQLLGSVRLRYTLQHD